MEINKDFYDSLPGTICAQMDNLITKYGKESWFEKAWNEYREHVLNSSMDDMRMPGYVFKKYINEESNVEHSGILGMKWGVRRWQNEDGSLTEEGKKHYAKADNRWIRKESDKIYEKAKKASADEMNAYLKDMVANGEHGATARNKYNQKLAEVMRKNTSGITSPSGKVVEWVAKRGSVGVYMALADPGYDMSQVKNGVWNGGRIAYKTKQVETAGDYTKKKEGA